MKKHPLPGTSLIPPCVLLALFLLPRHAPAVEPPALDETELDRIVAATPLPRISPRPAGVAGVARPVISLNGTWKFSPSGAAGAHSKNIEVPGEWTMQGFVVAPGGVAEYWRAIDIPADWDGKVARLRFDGVHAVCKVFVNGREIGGHEGGFVPFELDATGAIRAGAANEIRVQVQTESIADSIACMSQYAEHQVGGIVRKATLFALPRTHVATQAWAVTFDERHQDATLAIDTEIDTAAPAAQQPAATALRHELFSPDGKLAATITTSPAGAASQTRTNLAVPRPLHWTPETPALYTLKTTLLLDGAPAETITQRIGFRQIEIKGNLLLVNGNPVKLHGVCRHEAHPLRGRSLTPELCREDALLFRAANCNFIRTSHYPPSEEFLDACDELGLFVEAEAAIVWINIKAASRVWRTWNHRDPQYLRYFLGANLDNVAANRGHPCVILWSLANESDWSPLFARVNAAVKRLDPARPTTFHDQSWNNSGGIAGAAGAASGADLTNQHYPSEDNPGKWSSFSRPLLFGEYAHLQCYNRHELVTDPYVREDWGRPLARMVDLMWTQPGLAGGSIWSGIDDVFHLPSNEIVGYGNWGVIDGWRRKKPEWFGVKKACTPVKFFDAGKMRDVTNGVVTLAIQNRYDFTNLKDIKIAWKHGSKSGFVTADLAPHAKGDITIPVSDIDAAGGLEITVTDPRGFECEREIISLAPLSKAGPARKMPALPAAGASFPAPPAPTQTDTTISWPLTGAQTPLQTRLTIDKRTGRVSLHSGEAALIDNAPLALMILPLNDTGGSDGAAGTVLTNKIETFTPVCKNWKPQAVTIEEQDGAPVVKIRGSYDEAEGETVLAARAGGRIEVSYDYTLKTPVNPRQWGIVFTLPRAFDTLSWNGGGIWTTTPADFIGRASGTAKANPIARKTIEEPRKDLSGTSWSDDANALGTNDFRSTKARIRDASLRDAGGHALVVESGDDNDSASIRAWVEGRGVKLLVAGFNTGGADRFFATHYSKERRPLNAGDKIKGHFFITP